MSASASAAGPKHGRHELPGSKPSWTSAVPKQSDVPAAQGEMARVWLAPRNADDLQALATAVSDPSNAQYGQFLSSDEYQAQFAPTSDQVAAVTQWLTGAGLQVVQVGPGNHYVAVSGSADAINAAFGTQLALFVVNGKQEQAPATALSVPDELSGVVEAITGLTTLGHRVEPADLGAPPAYVNGTPCSSSYGEKPARNLPQFEGQTIPYSVCGYTPSQLRGAYGVEQHGNAGQGQTVAITDAFDASTLASDADRYAQRHGDKGFRPRQFQDRSVPESQDDPQRIADCGGNGWYGEQALDVEAVHAMAPKAGVLYYGAASCYDDDFLANFARIVTDDDASIVTNSWGEPTFVVIDGQLYITIDQPTVDAYESIFEQGAVEGIGFYFSSGDNGDELAAYGYKHPDFPAGDPWVTAVGGTSLAIGRHNDRLFETGWGTEKYSLSDDESSWTQSSPFVYGAGGGFSQIFGRPFYQDGIVPSDTTGRAVPDVGMDADPTTGMLVGETQTFTDVSRFGPPGVHYGEYRVGGTSLASPLFAAAQADVQQGVRGRFSRIGFANPLIYLLARQRGMFYDATPQGDPGNVRADYANGENDSDGYVYSVRTFDQDSSLVTAPGWDDVTGVGTVTPEYLSSLTGINPGGGHGGGGHGGGGHGGGPPQH